MATTTQEREVYEEAPILTRDQAVAAMAELRTGYMNDSEFAQSLYLRLNNFACKKSLEARDLFDRGIPINQTDPPRMRFGLEPRFGYRLENTIQDMQRLLRKAATLIPGKTSWFLIDPQNVLLTVLFGANDLDEMNVAWLGLSRRLELAHQFLGKYEAHVNLEEEAARPVSPASTNPEIYSQFPTDSTARNRVTYLFDHVPHHQQQLPRSYAKSSGDLPAELPASSMLKSSFPARNPERNPLTVYYSARMERMELPTVGYPDEMSVVTAYMSEREEEVRAASTSQTAASGAPAERARGMDPISRGPLSQDIDYKTGANFFPPMPA
ncbi:hypothetical protein B0H14DRAFT_3432529 [Mycena olivaceomarginata]|nr:hypothetical protein B0H14DRAFT_3432529 [Mycena olivaceomarginata]